MVDYRKILRLSELYSQRQIAASVGIPHGSTIFYTQFEIDGWDRCIYSDPKNDSPISEAIMDRIVHHAYNIFIDGEKSMREHHSLAAESEKLI